MGFSPATKIGVGGTSPRPKEKNFGRILLGIVAMI
jgi:hypothetical protein